MKRKKFELEWFVYVHGFNCNGFRKMNIFEHFKFAKYAIKHLKECLTKEEFAERILLSHEPVYGLPWCLNIHGHNHNNVEPYKEGCKHITLAANVCGYTPVNLGKIIKEGAISDIPSIHRVTIDGATKRRVERS